MDNYFGSLENSLQEEPNLSTDEKLKKSLSTHKKLIDSLTKASMEKGFNFLESELELKSKSSLEYEIRKMFESTFKYLISYSVLEEIPITDRKKIIRNKNGMIYLPYIWIFDLYLHLQNLDLSNLDLDTD